LFIVQGFVCYSLVLLFLDSFCRGLFVLFSLPFLRVQLFRCLFGFSLPFIVLFCRGLFVLFSCVVIPGLFLCSIIHEPISRLLESAENPVPFPQPFLKPKSHLLLVYSGLNRAPFS
jgi:hypothetical protein